MPSIYTTIQGDTWDMIAYKVYGKEAAMVQLIEANNDLAHIAIFPAGVQVTCPTIAPVASHIMPPWRR